LTVIPHSKVMNLWKLTTQLTELKNWLAS
jgi:hypothetical protein